MPCARLIDMSLSFSLMPSIEACCTSDSTGACLRQAAMLIPLSKPTSLAYVGAVI